MVRPAANILTMREFLSQKSVTDLNARLAAGNSKLSPRNGKTAKDHASGAIRRNELNKAKRGDWTTRVMKEHAGGKSHPFPSETVSGKRHRPASFKAPRKAGKRKRS